MLVAPPCRDAVFPLLSASVCRPGCSVYYCVFSIVQLGLEQMTVYSKHCSTVITSRARSWHLFTEDSHFVFISIAFSPLLWDYINMFRLLMLMS